jgi:hypothetical integral membrane protein (TIGR02206 family)
MIQFFAKDFTGDPFVFLGGAHLAALVILLLINLAIILYRRRFTLQTRKTFRLGLATLLLVNELSWHVWNYAVGQWTLQTMLPLHICSLLVFASAWMLAVKSFTIYEFAYFLGIGAAFQAVMTPDLGIYGFPHYRFFQTFISHGGIVTAALYMTLVEGFRPTWKSLVKVAVWGNVYLLVVTGINLLIGSNYMFTLHKPPTASLFDVLGPWPIYLLAAEGIAAVVFLLLYLPFAIKDYQARPLAETA